MDDHVFDHDIGFMGRIKRRQRGRRGGVIAVKRPGLLAHGPTQRARVTVRIGIGKRVIDRFRGLKRKAAVGTGHRGAPACGGEPADHDGFVHGPVGRGMAEGRQTVGLVFGIVMDHVKIEVSVVVRAGGYQFSG